MFNFNKIKELINGIAGDVEKLEIKGVKSAAPRIRKALMSISKHCKEGRKEVQEIKARFVKDIPAASPETDNVNNPNTEVKDGGNSEEPNENSQP